MSRIKTHVRKGDLVEVIAGSQLYSYTEKDGIITKTKRSPEEKRGRVLQVFPEKSRVIVEGLRMIKKHQKKTQTAEGGIIEREGTIHISNVKLVEAKDAKSAKKPKASKK